MKFDFAPAQGYTAQALTAIFSRLRQLLAGVHREDKGIRLAQLYLELEEISDPAAPAADRARLFVRDNGAGKTQLCVRFPTGAVQVLATEP